MSWGYWHATALHVHQNDAAATEIRTNDGPDYGLLPASTKPSPGPILASNPVKRHRKFVKHTGEMYDL